MKASWSRDKKNEGKWLVQVVADDPFDELPAEGAEIDVHKKSGESSTVTRTKKLWEGEGRFDDAAGKPVGLYAVD